MVDEEREDWGISLAYNTTRHNVDATNLQM